MKKSIPLVFISLLLIGCSSEKNSISQVTESDLLHHNFVLQSVDSVAANAKLGNGPSIEFGEKLHISGSMCNRFSGAGELNNGVLTVKNLAATRMLCTDAQRNQWDQVINTVLGNGATVTLNDQQLTLRGSDHTLIYQLKDWVY